MRGLWDGFQEAASADSLNLSSARRALASSLTAAAGRDVTATIGRSGADRVPSQIALAYASPAPADTASGRGPAVVPAVVTSKDGASIAQKPVDNLARSRMARTDDKFDDPWMRGLMLTPSLQNSLIVTRVGDIDVTSLSQHHAEAGVRRDDDVHGRSEPGVRTPTRSAAAPWCFRPS